MSSIDNGLDQIINLSTRPRSIRSVKWCEDVRCSRDLSDQQKDGFIFLLGWFENWRVTRVLPADRESAKKFWREAILSKRREAWQLEQWGDAIAWWLRWLEYSKAEGKEVQGHAERMVGAVMRAGARRGLAMSTRKTYAGWVARYGAAVASDKEAIRTENARVWLGSLVSETKVSYATQKQALNALVFFFKDVCGMEEIDLGVKFRRRERHVPVVLSKKEVFRLIEKIEPKYRLKTQLQYGAGLRLKELMALRIKDVDIDRKQLFIRDGKGGKDRVTVLPESLLEPLHRQIERWSRIGLCPRDFVGDWSFSL